MQIFRHPEWNLYGMEIQKQTFEFLESFFSL
jgi:hypothetical protein